MLLLRIVVLLAAFLIATGIVAYVWTGDKRHLHRAWQTTRYALIAAFVFMLLLFLELVRN